MILTEKQQEVLDFIVNFREEHGYSPTVGDIRRGLGYNSVPAARVHVMALEKKGKIRTTPNVSRSIVVL
jgi:repressor LexA